MVSTGPARHMLEVSPHSIWRPLLAKLPGSRRIAHVQSLGRSGRCFCFKKGKVLGGLRTASMARQR